MTVTNEVLKRLIAISITLVCLYVDLRIYNNYDKNENIRKYANFILAMKFLKEDKEYFIMFAIILGIIITACTLDIIHILLN